MSIHEKLYKIQSEIGRLKKDSNNPHFKNSYADINTVLDEVIPQLSENNILLMQPMHTVDNRNVLITKMIDIKDGSLIESSMMIQDGLNAQQTGSAITYYRRYEIISMLGLQAVDDDGKAGSNPVREKKKPTEEMVLEMESLMNGDDKFKSEWLNFIGVESFDKASFVQLEKAIKNIKGGK